MVVPNAKHSHLAQKTHTKPAKPKWSAHDPAMMPTASVDALRRAMTLEHVPDGEFADLAWLMAQESNGVVDAKNRHSTARGLFQLLKAQYDLNPNGEKSFGNAVEECQGGIRYIVHRYKTAAKARAFWEKHHWY